MMIKTYTELIKIPTYKERVEYLMLYGKLFGETFGKNRQINQVLYKSRDWFIIRNKVIIRDNGNDLGLDGYPIFERPIVHHITPVTIEMILNRDPLVFDMDNLISTSKRTHDLIHYAFSTEGIEDTPVVRKPNDTKLW